MRLTARQFAEQLVSRMETSGMGVVVFIKDGKVNSATQGTTMYRMVQQNENYSLIGFYTPECLCRHMVDDLKEFFD